MDQDLNSKGKGGVRRLHSRRPAWLFMRASPDNTADGPYARSLAHRFTYVAALLGVIAALVGAGHLAAWLGGYMSQRGLGMITMKTNAALCLTLVGVALVLLVSPEARHARRWMARACAALALLVGFLTLVENLSGWDFGIDQLLAVETPGALGVASPNRVGTPASLSFTLLGLALLLLSRRDHRRVRMVQALALAVCLIALLSTIGFLYGAEQFYGIARYTGIALPTAVALLLTGLGLLCARPGEGLMAQVTANDPGGASIRRLLPAFVILPLLLGWLRLVGERAGVFDTPMGTGMMMLLFILIFSALTYHTGRWASRSTQALRLSQQDLDRAQEVGQIGWWRLDTRRNILTWSDENHRIFGVPQGTPLSYDSFLAIVHPEDRQYVDTQWQAGLRGEPYDIEHRIVADGRVKWVREKAYLEFGSDGGLLGGFGITQDITARKQADEALRELNATLEGKVVQRTAELQRRAKQLQRLTLELTQAEERERRRIAVILHEDLQQQMAGAKLHLNLVQGKVKDDRLRADLEEVEEILKGAIEQSRSLSRDLSPTVVNMDDLGEVLQWLAHRIRAQQGLTVNFVVSGDMRLHSEGLALFLFRAAQEMLFNVVKHAQVREAAVRVRRLGRYVCLWVSDQGRGFDLRELKETSGVGLFSLRERTELLGGRLKVKSAKGRGSKFSLTVPDGRKPEDRRQKTDDRGPTTEDRGRKTDSDAVPRPPSAVLRVLLVDDHEVVRAGLAALLGEAPGVELVGAAPDGREAIKMAIDLRPDVVIMDVSMPLMGGDQATRQIKSFLPQTRVIALSMYDEAEKRQKMFEAGAEGYLLKTVSAGELLAALRGPGSDS